MVIKMDETISSYMSLISLLQSDPDYYLGAEQVRHCIWCAYEALKGC